MIRKKKNSGFTLVEVIVSMLVLSITIVSVLSAFSLSTKVNTKTKKAQSAESLMENLTEYLIAHGDEMDDYIGYTSAVTKVPVTLSETDTLQTITLENVANGFYSYKVEIKRDLKPSEYNTDYMNDHEIISFGGGSGKTALVNVNGAAMDSYDLYALDCFYSYACEKVDYDNAIEEQKVLADPTYVRQPEKFYPDYSTFKGNISRELMVEFRAAGTDKLSMEVNAKYTINEAVPFLDGVPRTMTQNVQPASDFDISTAEDAAGALRKLYIIYDTSHYFSSNITNGEIRILDHTGSVFTGGNLKADIFIVYQDETVSSIAEVIENVETNQLSGRLGDKSIHISFGEAGAFGPLLPNDVTVYSNATISLDIATVNVDVKSKQLIEKTKELRVETLDIKIYDASTGSMLLSKKMARQR